MEIKIAIGAGYGFAVVPSECVKGISLKNTGQIVSVDGEMYPLYKGETYEDSRQVDAILDSGEFEEYQISNCLVKPATVAADEELEFTNAQTERLDEIDNTVYQALLVLLEKTEEELPWDMSLIGPVVEAIADACESCGYHMRYPTIVTEKDGSQHYEE